MVIWVVEFQKGEYKIVFFGKKSIFQKEVIVYMNF